MALLYDANGREIYEGGITREAIRDAIQAASLADEWRTAEDIANRYGWANVCLRCAIKNATETFYDRWRVCGTCHAQLRVRDINFSDTKLMLDGLLKRSVQ